MPDSPDATWVSDRLARLRAGDAAARDELVAFAAGRLERLSHGMLRGQFGRVGRWVDTADVFQDAAVRLWRALAAAAPESPLHFHRLAARLVRLELIDLARQYYGPLGLGANHETVAPGPGDTPSSGPAAGAADRGADPARAAEWGELHAIVQGLPDEEQAVTDLVYYQGLTQEEAAALLDVDVRTVQRRWQRARRLLGQLLTGGE
jgi:RNA polymerase sigma-70 factor (ECF subfamily)